MTTENFNKYRSSFHSLLQENMQSHIDCGESTVAYCTRTTEKLYDYLCTGNAIVFFAIEEDNILGLIWGYPRKYLNQNQLFLQLIQVHESQRNRGVGTVLLKQFESYAFSNGYDHIELITSIDNENAQKFYVKAGFISTRIHFAKEVSCE